MSLVLDGSAAVLINDSEAARLLGISRSMFRKQVAAGQVPQSIKIGRCRRWRREEVRDWARAGCPPRDQWSWPTTAADHDRTDHS